MRTDSVYILARASSPERGPYIGCEHNGPGRWRVLEHNAGTCGCTNAARCATGRPWTLAAVVRPFHTSVALKFEQLLKTAPGTLSRKLRQAEALAEEFPPAKVAVLMAPQPSKMSDRVTVRSHDQKLFGCWSEP
eukprot:COSAG02_NODE_4940_length_4809_cov_26.880042_4_plen_134_part_00